jgi:hypothetical protein
MQTSQTCCITSVTPTFSDWYPHTAQTGTSRKEETAITRFEVINSVTGTDQAPKNSPGKGEGEGDGLDEGMNESVKSGGGTSRWGPPTPNTPSKGQETAAPRTTAQPPKVRDPLHMFGIFTPPPLRLAQTQARRAVEEIFPSLINVDAELKELEIRIRRGRKYLARAEAAEEKEKERETERAWRDAQGEKAEVV